MSSIEPRTVTLAKLLLLTFLVLFFVSCNEDPCKTPQKEETTATSCTPPTPTPDPDPTPEPEPSGDVPPEASMFDANIKFNNFQVADEEKVHKAIEIIKKVIGSDEFRNRILNFTYEGKKQFVDNKGLSNSQIYQILLDGKEDLLPEVDHEMDLELELYYTWSSTVGYTTPGVLKIFMNTKFFNPYTPTQVAGNVFHEWTHKLGFDHATSYSISRDSSVPYAVGSLIVELGKKYEE
jgi:hypothetical protein